MARINPEKLVNQVGRRIAELRREDGLTQEGFAAELGASVQWVSRVEAGANLTIHSLAKVANALQVGIADLFAEPGPEVKKTRRGRPRKSKR